jgi:hypothetical protein
MAFTPRPAQTTSTSGPPLWAQYPHLWPWLCLYCHTVQEAGRLTCANCGAPKSAPQPEAQP